MLFASEIIPGHKLSKNVNVFLPENLTYIIYVRLQASKLSVRYLCR